jgi:uncharacterized protein (TIGR04255 family)
VIRAGFSVQFHNMALLPDALARDTIVECVFEMRFSGGHPSVAEILPGLLFGQLTPLFKTLTPLPLGQVPRQLRDQNPQLQYAPTHTLEGSHLRMMFGSYVAGVSFPKPYAGWKKVQPLIMKCMSAVFGTKLTGKPERFSLKYVNLLRQGRDEFDLSQTTMRLELGEFEVRKGGNTFLRAEIERNGCVSVVDIASGGKILATHGDAEATGVMVSVDVILPNVSADPLAGLPEALELLHSTEKEIFFGLLAKQTLEKLGPTYPNLQ